MEAVIPTGKYLGEAVKNVSGGILGSLFGGETQKNKRRVTGASISPAGN